MCMSINNHPEYFIMIAQTKNLSAAAARLYVSQPYLSQYLIRLEKELNVKLFDRVSPLRLTKAGEIYYTYLQDMKNLTENFFSDLHDIDSRSTHIINLGLSPWRGSTLLPDILPIFFKKYRDIQIVLHEHPANELSGLVKDGYVDLAIMNSNLKNIDNMASQVIYHEKILLVANKNNEKTLELCRAIQEGWNNPLSVIEKERFILLNRGLIVSEQVHRYLSRHEIHPKFKIMTTNNTTAINLVGENIGFAFLIETGAGHAQKNPDLIFFDLKAPELTLPLIALYRQETKLSGAAQYFIEILGRVLKLANDIVTDTSEKKRGIRTKTRVKTNSPPR